MLSFLLRARALPLLLLALPLLLSGCVPHFIAPYDPALDSTMTQVQQDTEAFFTQLQFAGNTDAGTYTATRAFYQHTEPTLRTLLTRAQAAPKSHLVADQIANILAGIEKLQATHQRDGMLNPTLLTLERTALESQFRSFFTLELALKSRPATPSPSILAPALSQ